MRANTDGETLDYKFRCDRVSSAGHEMKRSQLFSFLFA